MSGLDINILKEIGKFTHKLRKEVSKLPKSGLDIVEIIDFVESNIFEAGYMPAFPCGVSINDVAAHFTIFDEKVVLEKGDVVKIDFGISHNGYITDNAITIEVEDNKYEHMIKTSLDVLNKAVDKIDVGISLSEIGKEVYDTAKKEGYNTIHNLSGHQISRSDLHYGMNIPNYDNLNLSKIEENTEFAIEPFLTKGEPKVKSVGKSNHLRLISEKNIRDPIAKKVLLFIKENFSQLPFSKRWLLSDVLKNISPQIYSKSKGFDIKRVNYAINILKKQGIVYEYDCLVSVDGNVITQFEDTVVFDGKKKIVLTRL